MSLQEWQMRVVEEKRELDEKLAKLTAFIDAPTFAALPYVERSRLKHQWYVMRSYSDILGERIEAWSATEDGR